MKHIIENYKQLNIKNKSLIYLMWIYFFWHIITWIFINIYVFKLFQNIISVLAYNLVLYSSALIGFSLMGFVISALQKNIKISFFLSYISFMLSFLVLFIFRDAHYMVFLFAFLYGFWFWNYRCAIHTYELKETSQEQRDFYSSIITAWENTLTILTPFLISFIFFATKNIGTLAYSIIFAFLPLTYVLSFFFIKNLPNFTPDKISKKDIRNFFEMDKIYNLAYFFFSSQTWNMPRILISLVSLYILKTELNIWIFQWIVWFLSVIFVLFLSHRRHSDNRAKLMFISALFICLNFIVLGFNLTLVNLIIFTLIDLIVAPTYRVSEHVYDLKYMSEINPNNNSFFATMISREIFMWLWRAFFLLTLIIFFYFNNEELSIHLKIGIIIAWIPTLLSTLFVFLEEKRLNSLSSNSHSSKE